MYAIFRQSKKGRVYDKILATGNTVAEAWDMFNKNLVYLKYREDTLFVCMVK